jgi:hypothetical protein
VRTLPFLVLLAGCATVVSQGSESVKEAVAKDVESCKFLRTLSATSPFYGVFAGQAMTETRQKLFAEAEAIGATHLVLGHPETGYGSTTQHAKAFACK